MSDSVDVGAPFELGEKPVTLEDPSADGVSVDSRPAFPPQQVDERDRPAAMKLDMAVEIVRDRPAVKRAGIRCYQWKDGRTAGIAAITAYHLQKVFAGGPLSRIRRAG